MNQLVEEKGKTFKTEEDKVKALEELQNRGVTDDDLPEIESIMNAEVEGEKPEEAKPSDNLVETEEDNTPQEPEEKPENQGKQENIRNWTIDEDLLSKYDETYVDETGRKRPLFTHKDPESFLKSYRDGQKHIRYLESKKLPQEFESGQKIGFEKAKSEYEEKIAALQKQLEERKQPEPAKPTTPEAPKSDSFSEYSKILSELDSIQEGDEIEHVDKLKKALSMSRRVLEERDVRYADKINELEQKLNQRVESIQSTWQQQQEEKQRAIQAQQEQEERQKKLESLYGEIDNWAKNEAPKEAKSDQSYKDMLSEATEFHNKLAEIYTGKTRRDYDPKQWNSIMEKAGSAYLNDLPELKSKANEYGISEPRNYRKWVYQDNIDAIRSGYIRNSNNEWEQRYDPVTGRPISFPDMKSAYNWWLDQTGQREKQQLEARKKDNEKLLNAVNKRDMAQLSEEDMVSDEDGGTMTEEIATRIVQHANSQVGIDTIIQEAMRGNVDNLNKLNAALERLGMKPIPLY